MKHITSREVIDLSIKMGFPCSVSTLMRWRRGYWRVKENGKFTKKKYYFPDSHLRLAFNTAYDWNTNKGFTYSKSTVVAWIKQLTTRDNSSD